MQKKKDPIFKANFIYIFFFLWLFLNLILYFWESNLYSRFLIFAFWYLLSICCCCYQFSTFKNPIFSTYFYLGARLLAWLLSCPLDSPFSPPGGFYLLPPPSLLYTTQWISLYVLGCGEHLGNWLLAGSVSLLLIPPFSSWPPLSPSLSSSLWKSVNISVGSRLWRAHKEVVTGLLALSPFDFPSSPPGHLYLLPPSSHLHVTLCTYPGVPHCGETFHH